MLSDELVLSVTVFQRDDCVYAVSSFCIAHYSLWILIAVLTVYINVGELHLTQLIGFILTVYTLYHIGWKALMHRFHLNRKSNRDVGISRKTLCMYADIACISIGRIWCKTVLPSLFRIGAI